MQNHTDNISVDAGFDTLDYNYENRGVASDDLTVKGERHLWCAVIYQAMLDLEDETGSVEARRWLLRDRRDFVLVCSLAGISPLAVRMAALARVEALAVAKKEKCLV